MSPNSDEIPDDVSMGAVSVHSSIEGVELRITEVGSGQRALSLTLSPEYTYILAQRLSMGAIQCEEERKH